MSGFFKSVAARARGEAPAVRPRLPNRFENAGPEPLEFSVETIAESRAPREPVEFREPLPSRPPSPASPGADSPPAPAAVSEAEPARAEAGPPQAPLAPQAARLAARPLEAMRVAPPAPPLPIDAPSSVADPIRRTDASKPEARLTAAAKLFTPARGEAPIALATSRPAPDEPAPRAPRARAERSTAALPEETTVHVSIGRIEVRAAQASPESKRRDPPRSPVMSLEDYLKSRRGRQ